MDVLFGAHSPSPNRPKLDRRYRFRHSLLGSELAWLGGTKPEASALFLRKFS